MTPITKKITQATSKTFANFSIYSLSYAILAPMTNERPIEIVKDIKPTERLSF
jgi:hypothetical protein